MELGPPNLAPLYNNSRLASIGLLSQYDFWTEMFHNGTSLKNVGILILYDTNFKQKIDDNEGNNKISLVSG